MTHLRFERLRRALPAIEDLDPLIHAALSASRPDPDRTWSAAGEVDTIDARLVDPDRLRSAVPDLVEELNGHRQGVFEAVGRAVQALAEGREEGAALALLDAARLEEARGRASRARAYAEAAFEALSSERDRSTAALALRRWARAARAEGDLGESLRRYEQAYGIGFAIGDGPGSAEAAIGAGNVLEQQGRWDLAESWYRRALALTQPADYPGPEQWHALLTLHIVLRSTGRIDESVEMLRRAEESARRIEDRGAAVFLENASGQLAMAKGDFAEAEARFRDALERADRGGAEVTVRLNLAEALLAVGRALDAAEEARHAEHLAVKAGLTGKLPEVYRLLGRIAAARGHPDAFVLFDRALAIVAERGLPPFEEAQTLQAYAQVERARGEAEAGDALERRARAIYEELGITDVRSPFADVFGSRDDPRGPNAGPQLTDSQGSSDEAF